MGDRVNLDEDFSLYNRRLLDLAAGGEDTPRLHGENVFHATAVSPICGSKVTIDLQLDDVGRVTACGFASESCALTRSVLAVMRRAMIGATRKDVAAAGAVLADMLAGGQEMPAGDWADLRILQPVKDYTARHNAILLPFVAVEKAFENSTSAPTS